MAQQAPQDTPQDSLSSRHGEFKGPSPHPISVELALDTAVYSFSKSKDVPLLSLTMTSHFMHPITIRTFGMLMEPDCQWRFDTILSVTNTSTEQHVILPGEKRCRKSPISLCQCDQMYYLTLPPGVPITVSHRLYQLTRWERRNPDHGMVYTRFDGVKFHKYFEPGHEYRIGLTYGLMIDPSTKLRVEGPNQLHVWWRYGAKEDVLKPRNTPSTDSSWRWSNPKIKIGGIPDVLLKVEE